MITVKFKIVIPGAKEKGIKFHDDLDPGVISSEEVTFKDMPDDLEQLTSADVLAIMDYGEKLLYDNVKVEREIIE